MAPYLDTAERKKALLFWIITCLTILHVWGSLLIYAVVVNDQHNQTIDGMFTTIGWGIFSLILILGFDEAGKIILSRLQLPFGQTVEKTTTERTVVTPATAENVEVKADTVNVTGVDDGR